MLAELTPTLLLDVKNELGYQLFESNAELDDRLERYLRQGDAMLERIAGAALDYAKDAEARGLLVDFCRYANAQASSQFAENYAQDLASLHARYTVNQYSAAREGGDGDGEAAGVSDV